MILRHVSMVEVPAILLTLLSPTTLSAMVGAMMTSHVSAATIPTTSPARRRPVLTAGVAAILLSLEPLTDGRLMVGVIGARPASVGCQLMNQSPVIPPPASMVKVVVILVIPLFPPTWSARVGVMKMNHANAALSWMFPARRRPVLTAEVAAFPPLRLELNQYQRVG